jgi:hypothetical protein
MRVRSWVLLKDGKFVFPWLPPSLIRCPNDTAAAQHVRTVKEIGLDNLETWNLNQDPSENTYEAIFFVLLLNNNPVWGSL